MLITDSREQRTNPLAPRGRSLRPDFAGVIVPDSDAGDLWLRRMENPSHDSVSSGQIRSERDRREADSRFRQARRELGEIIERRAEIANYGDPTNIDELAGILPDEEDSLGGGTDEIGHGGPSRDAEEEQPAQHPLGPDRQQPCVSEPHFRGY